MENRKRTNDRIVNWITNRVTTEYVDDVSLVLIYGSYVNGTDNPKSDVDCYFIPKTERGYNMAVDFILGGVGYDIFPMSWDRVEGIADLKEPLLPLVGDVQIIYCAANDDLERFKTLQEKLKNNLSNNEYVRDIVKGKCEYVNEMCTLMNTSNRASEIRKLAGYAIMELADAAAIYNHDYYHFGLKKQFEDLENKFLSIPRSIVSAYKSVVEAATIDEVKKHTMKMFHEVCTYLNITLTESKMTENQSIAEGPIDAARLAGLYEEISSTFNKIYVCCESGNYILAFLSAVCLQQVLDEAREAGCPEYDILGCFDYKQLCQLHEVTQKTENDFVQMIVENGGHIKKYDSFEQFENQIVRSIK